MLTIEFKTNSKFQTDTERGSNDRGDHFNN